MIHIPRKYGFSIIEILVVIGILGIIIAISVLGFENMYRSSALRAGGSELYSALTEAQTKTLASKDGTVYGVHVSSTTVTRFVGPTYTAGAASSTVYTFEGGVTATSTFFTGGGNIIFNRLTGTPTIAGTTTIHVRNSTGSATTTIYIYGTGLIGYN